ncbi:MAG: hypothetical protein HRU26_00230, partial [Psychroserpens sp.]|nr:hypothetical protein [Psychroserpens sp.]
EEDIAPLMKKASVVFIPGHSGLSVNHAFAYGRPYITLVGPSHAPEIEYIDKSVNGFVLSGSLDENVEAITSLLKDETRLEALCHAAKEKGEYLSIENWVEQMKNSLINESKQA